MKDHALVQDLMGELRMLDGRAEALPRPAVERFVMAAVAIDRGDELFAIVRNVGGLASAFAATKNETIARILVAALEPLLERLRVLAERDVANEQRRLASPAKPAPVRGAGAALAPANAKGASVARPRKGN